MYLKRTSLVAERMTECTNQVTYQYRTTEHLTHPTYPPSERYLLWPSCGYPFKKLTMLFTDQEWSRESPCSFVDFENVQSIFYRFLVNKIAVEKLYFSLE